MKRLAVWVIALLLMMTVMPSLAGAKPANKVPTTPVELTEPGGVSAAGIGGGTGGSPGTWYVGATPPNVDYTKPVLLFVHGKGGWAGVWWQETSYHGTNDMYTYAYNNGYRTAFVDLYPEESMWDNGALLKTLIDRVTAYFGVSKVTIIAHSKGGVDANAASVHYGAGPKISRVVTLGSPHWGTPIADLAYSSAAWWIAALLGQTTNATYVMQTGYMSWYRSQSDGRETVPFYTFSGYKCGPVFSALWYGCIAVGGEDDGVVPVWSARIPGGTHLREGYWDHDEIRMGSRTWSYFAPVIRYASAPSTLAQVAGRDVAATAMPEGKAPAREMPGNQILRGGATQGPEASSAFPVESGVRSVTYTVYGTSPDLSLTLTGPDGAAHKVGMAGQIPQGDVFGGAWAGSITVDSPAAGQWQFAADAADKAGYLLVASLDSDLQADLSVGQEVARPGSRRDLAISFAPGIAVRDSQASAAVGLAGQKAHSTPAFARSGSSHLATVTLPAAAGIHNVTATVTGTLEDGTHFERTLIGSFAAVAPGEEP